MNDKDKYNLLNEAMKQDKQVSFDYTNWIGKIATHHIGDIDTVDLGEDEGHSAMVRLKGSAEQYSLSGVSHIKKLNMKFDIDKKDTVVAVPEMEYYDDGSPKFAIWTYDNNKDGSSGGLKNLTYLNVKGKPDGKDTTWHENGVAHIERSWSNGKQDGLSISYYETGIKKLLVTHKNGNLHGAIQIWFKDGSLGHEGNFKDDKKDGKFIDYNQDGIAIKDETFKAGKLVNQSNNDDVQPTV